MTNQLSERAADIIATLYAELDKKDLTIKKHYSEIVAMRDELNAAEVKQRFSDERTQELLELVKSIFEDDEVDWPSWNTRAKEVIAKAEGRK